MYWFSAIRAIFFVSLLPICLIAFGQDYSSNLLTNRIYQRIGKINDNISLMRSPNKDIYTREYYKNQALSMIYNCGDNYISPSDSVENEIRLSYISNIGKKHVFNSVKDYFTGLVNLRYLPVEIYSVNILSSCNIDFSIDTTIESPETFDISELKKFGMYYVLPCTILQNDTGSRIDAELYLLAEKTIDGIELIPLITGLHGHMENINIQH